MFAASIVKPRAATWRVEALNENCETESLNAGDVSICSLSLCVWQVELKVLCQDSAVHYWQYCAQYLVLQVLQKMVSLQPFH